MGRLASSVHNDDFAAELNEARKAKDKQLAELQAASNAQQEEIEALKVEISSEFLVSTGFFEMVFVQT